MWSVWNATWAKTTLMQNTSTVVIQKTFISYSSSVYIVVDLGGMCILTLLPFYSRIKDKSHNDPQYWNKSLFVQLRVHQGCSSMIQVNKSLT